MAYIESHQELRQHPKTRKAARLLGIGIPQMIGHLHCLWWWALDYAPRGELAGFEDFEIAEGAGWEGPPDELLQALITSGRPGQAGFVEVDELNGALFLHDWWEYGGKLIDARELAAKRQKRYRDRQQQKKDGTTNKTRSRRAAADEPSVTLREGDDDGDTGELFHNDNVTVTLPSRNGLRVDKSIEENITVENSIGESVSHAHARNAVSSSQKNSSYATTPTYKPLPAKWPLNDQWWNWAVEEGWQGTRAQLQSVIDNWLDNRRKTGRRFLDWPSDLREWIRRELRDFQDGVRNGAGRAIGERVATGDEDDPPVRVFVVPQGAKAQAKDHEDDDA